MKYRGMTNRFIALAMAGILAFPGTVLAEENTASETVTEAAMEETNPPETNPPETNPPETNPPETNPPETNPPETNPPETNPPETEAPTEVEPDATGESVSETGSQTEMTSSETEPMSETVSETEEETEEETETESEVDREAILKDYEKSRLFTELKNRMRYNVTVPIEEIPSFITQEMVVGALKCQDEYGFPASVTIAQIIAESGYGSYGPGGDSGQGLSQLAWEYCNLFGIKGSGTAGSVTMQTWEMKSDGSSYTTNAGFRAYHTYTECINDRAQLLRSGYSDLMDGVTDANTFAVQVGSRWATDLYYGKRLISIMEQYDLYRLDDMTLRDFSVLVGRFANPCPGAQLTSGFGYREFDHSFHKGLDLGTGTENIPTYAAESGTVIFAGYDETAGNLIIIDHGNGLVTKYMHHSEIYVQAGDQVQKGQQIGLSGSTGDSTGNHLHFQVEENGAAVDPAKYLLQESETQETESQKQEKMESETERQTESETEAQTDSRTEQQQEETEKRLPGKKKTQKKQKIFNDTAPFSGGTILPGSSRLSGGIQLSGGTKLSDRAVIAGGMKLTESAKLKAGREISGKVTLASDSRLAKSMKLSAIQLLMSIWPLSWMHR